MPHENVLSRIGDTPLVEINRLNPYAPGVRILAKIECVNPGGSIKDRVALSMIEAAEASGELTPDKIIIEATSGNTGIGLAMVAAVKGYRITLLMSEFASEERKMILRGFGATILETPGHLATDGAIELAYRMIREEPDKYVLMDQYNNEASIQAHYNGTGLEIWEQTGGEVTHVVSTLGTTGTCMGITRRMREMSPDVKVMAVEPYAGHKIQGLKNMHESYPPGIWDKKAPDDILHVDDETAFELCRQLARQEGIFAGMSSGAALGGALKIAERLAEEGRSGTVVAIFPDSGERYLSTPLFASKADSGMAVLDAATGEKVALPATGSPGLFTVGPPLDAVGDLDAWRRMALLDVLARAMRSRGVEPVPAVGLADLDDRALDAARKAGLSRASFAAKVRDEIAARSGVLGILPETVRPLASETSDAILALTRKLMNKGLAYEKLRSVYFDILRDKRYGHMGGRDLDKVASGVTVDLDAYVKDNPLDFTLLKRASLRDLKEGEVLETEWGNVRPTWFLQVAAAGAETLGQIGVFLAGEAQRFPHLENLRALWSVAGREVSAWMVDAPVQGEGEDFDSLLKAAGNPRALRMWLLSGAYRKPLPATGDNVTMWAKNWRKVMDGAGTLALALDKPGQDVAGQAEQTVFDLKAGLTQALDDDLSLHRFWPVLFKFVKDVHQLEAAGQLTGAAAKACLKQLRAVDAVLGILDESGLPVAKKQWPGEVAKLVAERQTARDEKDFAASDDLRDKIAALGYRVEDTGQGPRVYRD